MKIEVEGFVCGIIFEVREEVGFGIIIDVIIYDGILRKDDMIVVGGKDKVIVIKICVFLKLKFFDEIRDLRFCFD